MTKNLATAFTIRIDYSVVLDYGCYETALSSIAAQLCHFQCQSGEAKLLLP